MTFSTKMIQSKALAYGLAGAALLATTALTVTDAYAQQRGGKFTVHINRDIGGFDHIKVPQGGMGRYQVLFAVHERLFEPDPVTGAMTPRLGVKVTNSDDFKNWRVELRKGVRFSNGKELTSEAYVHHFQRILKSRLAGRITANIGRSLKNVVAIDKHTIEFQFGVKNLAFKEALMSGGAYVWFLNEPGFAKANENSPDYNRMSAGAGPYMVKSWIPGKGVTLVRNPNYWNPSEQHADEIFYRITTGPETAGAYNALRAGDIDVMWSLNGSVINRVKKDPKFQFMNGHRGQLHWSIQFQQSHPPLNESIVRRALAHATNRAAIRAVITKNNALPADQSFPKGSKWHCEGVGYPEFNINKAKALLKEYGKPIPAIDVWTLNIPSFRRTVEMLQAMWKEVGVTVNVKTGGRGPTGVVNKIIKGETPVWMNPRGSTVHPTVFNQNLHSKHKDNIWRANSPKIDAALDAINSAKGDDAIKTAQCNLEKAMNEEVVYLPIQQAIAAVVGQKNIGGLHKPNDTVLGYHRIYRK